MCNTIRIVLFSLLLRVSFLQCVCWWVVTRIVRLIAEGSEAGLFTVENVAGDRTVIAPSWEEAKKARDEKWRAAKGLKGSSKGSKGKGDGERCAVAVLLWSSLECGWQQDEAVRVMANTSAPECNSAKPYT